MRRLCTWGIGLNDTNMDDFYRNIDLVSIMVHVEGARLAALAETFATRNHQNRTIEQQLSRATALNLDVIAVIDWHYGNGRERTPGEFKSATGFGDYQHDSTEGGVMNAVNAVLQWSRDYPIIAIKIGNENKAAHVQYAALCKRVKDQLKGRLELIVGGTNRAVEMAAQYAEATSPHLLQSNWREALTFHEKMVAKHGTKIYPMECIALKGDGPSQYGDYLREILERTDRVNGDGEGFVACFTGNTTTDDGSEWPTGRVRKPPIVLNQHRTGGLNEYGNVWVEVVGSDVEQTVDVDAAVKKIKRQIKDEAINWVRGTWDNESGEWEPKLPVTPTKTVANILDDLGRPWEGE